jgi:hypothetical protein
MDGNLTALQRLWLAFVAFFAVLFNRRFAEEVHLVRDRLKALPAGGAASAGSAGDPARTAEAAPFIPPPAPPGGEGRQRTAGERTPSPAPAGEGRGEGKAVKPPAPPAPSTSPESFALHVLHLLQRDGRLVDFLSEDLNGFSDAEIGAAARTVHEGCRKTLQAYVELEPVYREAEGARVTVGQGFDASAVRLTGNVVGAPPFQGSLKHHGWRVKKAAFPAPPPGEAVKILAPAEVEL